MQRFVYNNLIYRVSSKRYWLINLISFRRESLSAEQINTLISAERKELNHHKLTEDEKVLLENLVRLKQILNEAEVQQYNELWKKDFTYSSGSIPVRSITINIAYSCNFNCSYCYQNQYKNKPNNSRPMTQDDIDEIIAFLFDGNLDCARLEEVIISGGEPLLCQNINTVNYALTKFKEKFNGIKIKLFTNGENILEYADVVDYNKIDKFQISLDGTAEMLGKINGIKRDVFNKIIDGIKYIHNLGKKIDIVAMFTPELQKNLDLFIESLEDQHLINEKDIRLSVNMIKNFYEDDFENQLIALNLLKKYGPLLKQKNIITVPCREASYLAEKIHRPLNSKSRPMVMSCDVEKSLPLVFSSDGRLYWCTCLSTEENCIGSYKSGGKLDLSKINLLAQRSIFTVEDCKNCRFSHFCGTGCILLNMGRHQNLGLAACGLYSNPKFWDNLEEYI